MSIIQAELYEALIEADASKEKAHAAAAAVAAIPTNYPKPEALATKEYIEKRAAELEARIAELGGRMDSKMADLKVHVMQQNKESTRMIIGAIAVATTVIVATITVLAFVS